MRYTPSSHVLLAGACSRSRAVQSITWGQLWRWGEGDTGTAAPSVLTWPSLFFTTDCKEEDEICTFRCGGPSSSRCLVALKDPIPAFCICRLPVQLQVISLPPETDSYLSSPAIYYFGKVVITAPLCTSAKNRGRAQWAVYPSREREKQFSRSLQISKWENILGCTGSDVEACPEDHFCF